jgi:hypothetical protein
MNKKKDIHHCIPLLRKKDYKVQKFANTTKTFLKYINKKT